MTEDYRPKSRPEAEIACAMHALWPTVERLMKAEPSLPKTAIGVALINLGVQVGVHVAEPQTITDYLRDVADFVSNGGFVHKPNLEETS